MDATLCRMSATATASTVDIKDSILDAIGATPLVRLSRLGAGLTPGDRGQGRVAQSRWLHQGPRGRGAHRGGRARRQAQAGGATIVELTSGNTGTGLAIAARLKGYRVIAVMPDKMSKEKIDLLRAYGAEVVVAPTAVPPESPESYYRVADRLAEEIPGAFQPNQYRNPANPQAHYCSTGPELWEQSGGRITHLVVGVGTGGTITGTGRYLKERNPSLQVIGADPYGSIYSSPEVKPYLVEGVGEDFWPQTYDPSIVDRYVTVSDRDAFLTTRRLAHGRGHPRRWLGWPRPPRRAGGRPRDHRPRGDGRRDPPRRRALVPVEGLQRRVDDPARVPGARHRPDGGRRALRQAGGGRDPAAGHRRDPLQGPRRRGAPAEHRVSQLPVVSAHDAASVVGSIGERGLLKHAVDDPSVLNADIVESWSPPSPRCRPATPCARRSSCWSAIVRR